MILVINCGSSSVKFALIEIDTKQTVLSGMAEKLGGSGAQISIELNSQKSIVALSAGTHVEAISKLISTLRNMALIDKVRAVGHRLVHGGPFFSDSVMITSEVISKIRECVELAPLHNPANLLGIQVITEQLPKIPQIGVFDTAFHQTLPEKAYLYAVPKHWDRDYKVRRYGFHGTSHRFITSETAKFLGQGEAQTNLICAHLGNGASITAISNGKSVDTSMGFTPLEGLMMGTRSGDIDPGLIPYLAKRLGTDSEGVIDALNKQSGLLGISELTNDCRELEAAAKDGHKGAILALELFCYRLAKYIVSYHVPVPNIQALVFTGGIGENSSFVRNQVILLLGFLNYQIDESQNLKCVRGEQGLISTGISKKVLVISTNEELLIAMDTAKLLGI